MKPRPLTWTMSLVLALGLGTFACSDEHDHDANPHPHPPGSHDPTSPSCADIMDICHAADTEPGPAHDCHEVAHNDVEGPCAAQKTSCIQTCEAVHADAGVD
jgi:hypothetical protein